MLKAMFAGKLYSRIKGKGDIFNLKPCSIENGKFLLGGGGPSALRFYSN